MTRGDIFKVFVSCWVAAALVVTEWFDHSAAERVIEAACALLWFGWLILDKHLAAKIQSLECELQHQLNYVATPSEAARIAQALDDYVMRGGKIRINRSVL